VYNLPPPSAHHMETPWAGSILPGVCTPLPTTHLLQVKSTTPAVPAHPCSCPAGTACRAPQPSAGENGVRRRPWHQVPIPREGATSLCPPGPAEPRVCWDAGKRAREGGVKELAGKPSPSRSQLRFSSASGSFHFPVSVSCTCGRGQSCWMKFFVKCVQISC